MFLLYIGIGSNWKTILEFDSSYTSWLLNQVGKISNLGVDEGVTKPHTIGIKRFGKKSLAAEDRYIRAFEHYVTNRYI